MAWLDRDRTPALFTIATSVSGSLISFLIINRLTDIPTNVSLIWAAAVLCLIVLMSWSGMYLLRRGRERSQRAFLIVSAFDQQYYIASFVRHLHSVLDRNNIDMVLKVPDRDYDASAQSYHLERALDRKHDYMGGVIFAGDVYQLRDDLTVFCQKSRLPVVFTDLEPFEASEYPVNSAYVGYDTGQLGELAGQWLVKYLRGAGIRRPQILIIASREHSRRQEECVRVLNKEFKGVSITIDDSCDFVRARAYDAVVKHIAALDSRHCLDAIFSTDDEMGLGAVDALAANPSAATSSTVVIGIDGVIEARALIDSGTSPFRASVIQNTHQLALGIVDSLVKMRQGRPVARRRILSGEIYEAGR